MQLITHDVKRFHCGLFTSLRTVVLFHCFFQKEEGREDMWPRSLLNPLYLCHATVHVYCSLFVLWRRTVSLQMVIAPFVCDTHQPISVLSWQLVAIATRTPLLLLSVCRLAPRHERLNEICLSLRFHLMFWLKSRLVYRRLFKSVIESSCVQDLANQWRLDTMIG